MIASRRPASVASGEGRGCLERVEVLVEDRETELEAIREVPVEAALTDARTLGDRVEGRVEPPLLGEHLASGRDERLAIRRAGARPEVGFRVVAALFPPCSGTSASVPPDNDVR